jgi:hypothetical protein
MPDARVDATGGCRRPRRAKAKKQKVDLETKTRLDATNDEFDLPFNDSDTRTLKGGEADKTNDYKRDTDESSESDQDGGYGEDDDTMEEKSGRVDEYGPDVEIAAEVDDDWTTNHGRLAEFLYIEQQSPYLAKQVHTGAFTVLAGTGLYKCWEDIPSSTVRTWVQETAIPPRQDMPRVVAKRACDCCGRTNRTTRCTMIRISADGNVEREGFYLGPCCTEKLANLARVIDLLHACSLVHHSDTLRMRIAIERVIDAADCAVAAQHMQWSGI